MATWNSRGLRGSVLEEMVNRTNEKYMEQGLLLVQKIPTPITPVRIDPDTRQIKLAYFEQRSTVDYIGVVQGIPLCFDAKESAETTFPLQNIHPHQVEFMKKFEAQGGIAFFLLYFSGEDLHYYLPLRHFLPLWERAEKGGRKSFRLDELDQTYTIPHGQGMLVPYLEMVNKDLSEREREDYDSSAASCPQNGRGENLV